MDGPSLLALAGSYSPTVLYGSPHWQQGVPRSVIPQHLPAYAIVGVVSGSHRITIEYEEWRLASGDLAILPPDRPWRHHLAPGSTLAYVVGSVIACRLRYKRARRALLIADKAPQPSPRMIWGVDLPVVQPPAVATVAMRDLESICDLWWRDELSLMRANLAFATLLNRIVMATAVAGASLSAASLVGDQLIASAIERLTGRRPPSTISEWATMVGLHRNRFSDRFKQATGESAAAFLRSHRLRRAELLLTDTDYEIEHIASECGFPSADSLGHVFAASHGCSPTRWRQQHRR